MVKTTTDRAIPITMRHPRLHSLLLALATAPLASLAATDSPARDVGWQTPVIIDTGVVDAHKPAIAVDSNGAAVVIWTQKDSIWSNRYEPDSGWSTARRIGPFAADAGFPQIAVDSRGNALAVWRQRAGAISRIWANRYDVVAGWGTAKVIDDLSAGDSALPQIAVVANGDAVAVWSQFGGAHYNILANRYTLGSGWGTATIIEANNLGDARAPQVATDASGNAVAVWEQFDGVHFDIWANRYAVGSGWSAPVRLEDAGGSASAAYVAMDPSGNATTLWQQADASSMHIRSNRYVVGSGWEGDTQVDTSHQDPGVAVASRIAVDASGSAVAVWHQSNGSSTNLSLWGSNHTVGSGWNRTASLLEFDAGYVGTADVAMDASGNATAVWQQFESVAPLTVSAWASRYIAGHGWQVAERIESEVPSAVDVQVAVDPGGNAIAVWSQQDGVRYRIRANRYQAD